MFDVQLILPQAWLQMVAYLQYLHIYISTQAISTQTISTQSVTAITP